MAKGNIFRNSLLVISSALFIQSPAMATNTIYSGNVSSIQNGWGGEGYYFTLSGSVSNGCTQTTTFIIQSTKAQYNAAVANLMMAFATQSHVNIAVDGTAICYSGAGNVLGVQLSGP